MKLPRAEKLLYALIVFIAIAGSIGMGILIMQIDSTHLAVYEIMAFTVSILAVTLAVLGAISNMNQAIMMRGIAGELRKAISELRDIDKSNDAISRRINEDFEISKDIAEALREAGIIEDDERRHAVASSVEKKVRAKVKH